MGFEVVGVDIAPQPAYPFEFQQGDALDTILSIAGDFDLIHASPPCQRFTAYRSVGPRVGEGYKDLIDPTRELLRMSKTPYVIENVAGAPLVNPVQLCGSSFALDIRRHRLFEASFSIPTPRCDHEWQKPRFAPSTNRKNLRRTVEVGVWRIPLEVQQRAMGIDWMKLEELSEAIPPVYTQHIATAFLASQLNPGRTRSVPS